MKLANLNGPSTKTHTESVRFTLSSREGTTQQIAAVLFTRDFVVKAAKADRKGLQRAEWVLVVHCEHVLADAPKLQQHWLLCLVTKHTTPQLRT